MTRLLTKNHLSLIKDIRFWLVFFFVLRLYGITNPPLEVSHSWRQITSITVAKNFYEIDNTIFFPRVDELNYGNKTGIISMEFPFQNYLIYIFYLLFGYNDWYGRLINLIITTVGIYYFFKTIKLYFNDTVAFFSSITLICSIFFAFARKTMPDTFSISLIFISIYNCLSYFKTNNRWNLLFFTLFGILGALSKIPSIVLFSVLILPIFQTKLTKSLPIVLGLLLIFLSVFWWYYYWNLQISLYFKESIWSGRNLSLYSNFKTLANNSSKVFENFYFHAISFSGFFIFCFGIIKSIISKNRALNFILLLYSALFFIFMLKAGRFFYIHNYYIIPFVPIMCFFIGYFLSNLKNNKLAYFLLILIAIENIANQQHDFRIKKSELYKTTLKEIAQKHIPKNARVATNGDLNPQLLFFLDRKGWSITNEQLKDQEILLSLKNQNCKYIIIDKNAYSENLIHNVVFQNSNFIIYKL